MISRRLRYEILRRDNHTCRYCGAAAPGVPLTVDHVIPSALGGTDAPENLVTACRDCNAGKTSTTPGAPLVADVAQDALKWTAAIKRAAVIQQADRDSIREWLSWFEGEWVQWVHGPDDDKQSNPLPWDWEQSVQRMLAAGVDGDDLRYAIKASMQSYAETENKFRYFAGVIWRLIEERQQIAKSLLADD